MFTLIWIFGNNKDNTTNQSVFRKEADDTLVKPFSPTIDQVLHEERDVVVEKNTSMPKPIHELAIDEIQNMVYDCFDSDSLEIHRTAECNNVISLVIEIANSTTSFDKFHFAIVTLFSELSYYELKDIIDRYVLRANIELDSQEYFWIAQAAFSSKVDPDSIGEYYKSFFNLNKSNRIFALRGGLIEASLFLLASDTTRLNSIGPVENVLLSLEYDEYGLPEDIYLIEVLPLKAALAQRPYVEYIKDYVRDHNRPAMVATRLLSEATVVCNFDPVQCEVLLENEQYLKDAILKNYSSYVYTEQEQEEFFQVFEETNLSEIF